MTPYVTMRFDILPDMLLYHSSSSSFIVTSIVGKRVDTKCPSLWHRVTLVELVELNMLDFDVILCMDWLYSCYIFY